MTNHSTQRFSPNKMKFSRFLSPLLGFGILLPSGLTQVSHAQFGRPVTIAVRKVKDRANAGWFRPAYEQKLADIMATELANSGNFTVVGRQDEGRESIKIPQSRKIILLRLVMWLLPLFLISANQDRREVVVELVLEEYQ